MEFFAPERRRSAHGAEERTTDHGQVHGPCPCQPDDDLRLGRDARLGCPETLLGVVDLGSGMHRLSEDCSRGARPVLDGGMLQAPPAAVDRSVQSSSTRRRVRILHVADIRGGEDVVCLTPAFLTIPPAMHGGRRKAEPGSDAGQKSRNDFGPAFGWGQRHTGRIRDLKPACAIPL
jgi:hypothetical protein